jgi:PGF-pre-PGF domain-containing protein
MKLRKSLIEPLVLAVLSLMFLVGAANAGCVGEITGIDYGCGDTVIENCTLNGNMNCDSGHGLIVGADDITIDGAGYKLDGDSPGGCTGSFPHTGIMNVFGWYGDAMHFSYNDVTIKNLEITNFCNGIYLNGGGNYNHIYKNIIENCNIYLNGNSTSPSATHGIKMEYVFNSTIQNNRIHHQLVHVDPNPGCEDGGNGLFLYKGDYNNIIGNRFYNNTKAGMLIKMKPKYWNISHNNLWGNGQGGIILRCMLCDFNLIEHNNASDNHGSGIFIGGNNNTIRYNTVCNNRDGGHYYEDSVGGHGYGINIGRGDGSCNNTLISNKICGNGYLDIYVVPSVTGNHGDENTCDTTSYYDDEGTTGCTYDCSPAPDLVITEMSEEWVNLVDKTYTITYTVKNIGDADAGTSNTSIMINGAEVATDSVPGLASGESHTNGVGPFTMSGGSDTIRVSADSDNEILEKSREYNNYLENIFRHPEMPDLMIIDKSEAWIVEGSSYNITYTIKNIADATAGASTSTTSIKIDGTEVATDSVKTLNASENYTSTLGPFTMSGNSDTILICADCGNSVTENNEENNCKENIFEYSSNGGGGDSTCSDGTSYGACSVNKPKYCDNGILIDDCVRCGCPEGQTCDVISGSCYVPGEGACIGATKTFTCGDTVTESCTLNGTMGCPPGHGLIIGADGITIDGTDHKIIGDKSAEACAGNVETGPSGGAEVSIYCGIYNNGYDYVTITNLEIENFCTGIGLFGSGANIVENNKITDCIIHDNGLSTPFEGMDMVTHGIHASYVKHLEITGNDIYSNEGTGDFCGAGGNGIFIYAGVSENYCDISHNKLHDNAKSGFWTKMKLSQSTISHNDVYGNGNGAGIADDVRGGIVLRCKLSNENLIAYNDVHDHSADGYGYGIYVGGGSNTIEHNTVTGNSRHGISMARSDGSFNNELYNNLVCDNGVDMGVTSGVTGNHGDENTCDTTNHYDDDGTTGCTYSCPPSSEGESGGTGESEEERIEESKEITFIEAGANASLSFNETDIVSITIYVKNDVANFSISVQQFDEPPANITNLTGVLYRYVNITATNITDADLINATVRFGVNRSWIVDESIDEDTIRLNRYNYTDENWTVLPTTKINETENNATVYFEVITPGFSLFLITGEQKIGMEVAKTTPAPTSTQIADEKIKGASTWIPEMPAETSTPVEVQTEISGSFILIILIASLSVA